MDKVFIPVLEKLGFIGVCEENIADDVFEEKIKTLLSGAQTLQL